MPPPPILLVENDPHLAAALVDLLAMHGIRAEVRRDPFDAMSVLRNNAFSLVVTDYRLGTHEDSERTAKALLDCARSTPVGCITGVDQLPRDVRQRYVFAIRKPFTIEHLLMHVAPWAAPQECDQSRVELVTAYFESLSARDWDALVELCAPSVEYNAPPGTPWTQTIRGRADFRRHTEEVFKSFPDAKFKLLETVWLPRGLIARFRSIWKASSLETSHEGAVLFAFDEGKIAKVGVELQRSQLW